MNAALTPPNTCPLCGNDAQKPSLVTPHVYGGRKGQAFYRCQECKVIFLNPTLRPDEQAAFYAKEFEGFMEKRSGGGTSWNSPKKHISDNEDQRIRRMAYLEEVLPEKGGRILEVGCSSGFMLWPLRERGYECVGVEPSGVFSEFLRSEDLTCFDSFEYLTASDTAKGGFDLIMHFFVLEHVSDPEDFIRAQVALLRPGGRLVVEAPSADDALWTVYDVPAFEHFYWSVAHNWYFTDASFRNFLEQLGFQHRVIHQQRYDLSNHMQWALDGKPGGAGRFTGVLGAGIEEQYKIALVEARKCDTVIGILQKSEDC